MINEIYRSILKNQALPRDKRLFSNYFIFMDDNDLKHTNKISKNIKKLKKAGRFYNLTTLAYRS